MRSENRGEPLIELESESVSRFDTYDPTEDPAGRRCLECGELLVRWNQRVHGGRCARARKTRLQKMRRARGRP
jgi:hypothetical protein